MGVSRGIGSLSGVTECFAFNVILSQIFVHVQSI